MILKINKLKEYFVIKNTSLFDEKFYLRRYSDVRRNDIDPLKHFILYGWKERRLPNPYFDYDFFYENFPECHINPLYYIIKNKISINCIKCKIKEDNYIIPLNKFPLVSIIILNRNGAKYLETLLKSIKSKTLYKNFEIIIVDNASTDNSINIIKKFYSHLPIKVIKNKKNYTFSKANNDAVKHANGELLLFLNNDTEPINKGWLCELVKEYVNNPKFGSAGSKLIYPYKKNFKNSCKIQHAGIKFKFEGEFYRPYNIGNGDDIHEFNEKKKRAALTAACLLVPKTIFNEVGGFDEEYNYGYEDVDLGLKILKKGYENIYVPTSLLYHYEFGTQSKDNKNEIKNRRLNNIKVFRKKWHLFLKKNYWKEKLNNKDFLFTDQLHIAFIVSNKGINVAEGDYFTALEFGESLKKLGYKISYLSLKHNEWYNFNESIDIIISLLDKYDVSKIIKYNKKVITIAWARNWFDRWIKNKSFKIYDIILSSSKKSCEYIKTHTNKDAILFPIATNPERFIKDNLEDEKFKCDYCFTGNYWNDKREIIDFLNPEEISYKFHLYGKNWEKIKKFRPYFKGFINYENIPKVYENTKIVIDDANRVTKPFGSVNSRVFDALGKGRLVITNGDLGSKEIFDGLLPVYSNKEELYSLLKKYLDNEEERNQLVSILQKIVLENHTYEHRAYKLKSILEEIFLRSSILIKLPVPNWKVAHEWGDYHFGTSLKKEFEKLGYRVKLQVLSEWSETEELFFDTVLVLRGLSEYAPKDYHINIMWNISHPDKISINEYKKYDKIFIASKYYTEFLKNKFKLDNIETLLQCSDPELFKPIDIRKDIDILFVGNSRKVYRKIIKDLMSFDLKDFNIHIYGNNWEEFIDNSFIKGKYIPNEDLYKYYNRAKIVLNDHWDDMREKGFISNRIFDVSLCESFMISDNVKGLQEIFGDNIETYNNRNELLEKIRFYLGNDEKRREKAKNCRDIVIQNHTIRHRVITLHNYLRKFY